MKAVVFSGAGDSSTLRLVDREPGEPGAGEVRIRLAVAGVNPTDWKRRSDANARSGDAAFEEIVPGQDGAGVVDAVGDEVATLAVGDRVWTVLAQHGRPTGTAQEYVVLPVERVVRLPEPVSVDLGASLGVPAVTAHRALTMAEAGPDRLWPGALAGRTVLVHGGAGAVGHFAIQLARWAGATVVTTVSSPEKAALARAAGAEHVVDYRATDAGGGVRQAAPDGVDIIVDVAPAQNAELDVEVAANHATIAIYANNGGDDVTVPVRPSMTKNLDWHFLVLYTVGEAAIRGATDDITVALADGALSVGADAGLPLTRFPLARTAEAHDAVEAGAVGKVLIDVGDVG